MKLLHAVVVCSAIAGITLGILAGPSFMERRVAAAGRAPESPREACAMCTPSSSDLTIVKTVIPGHTFIDIDVHLECLDWGGDQPCAWIYNIWVIKNTTQQKVESLGTSIFTVDCGDSKDEWDSLEITGLANGSYTAWFGLTPGSPPPGGGDPDPDPRTMAKKVSVSFTMP